MLQWHESPAVRPTLRFSRQQALDSPLGSTFIPPCFEYGYKGRTSSSPSPNNIPHRRLVAAMYPGTPLEEWSRWSALSDLLAGRTLHLHLASHIPVAWPSPSLGGCTPKRRRSSGVVRSSVSLYPPCSDLVPRPVHVVESGFLLTQPSWTPQMSSFPPLSSKAFYPSHLRSVEDMGSC